ncbi:hypothetical protein DY000_02020087 [Brassica cretica]|uniref:Uncharacterized protein n=1 Tax=Brassica cretica TaxID=69181 RepID=A0ABQ7EMS3_BRACR|nr:hypothetical protein DY000_02020087 [Brassica cretica]
MGDVNANVVPTQADINAQLIAGQAQLTATTNAWKTGSRRTKPSSLRPVKPIKVRPKLKINGPDPIFTPSPSHVQTGRSSLHRIRLAAPLSIRSSCPVRSLEPQSSHLSSLDPSLQHVCSFISSSKPLLAKNYPRLRASQQKNQHLFEWLLVFWTQVEKTLYSPLFIMMVDNRLFQGAAQYFD